MIKPRRIGIIGRTQGVSERNIPNIKKLPSINKILFPSRIVLVEPSDGDKRLDDPSFPICPAWDIKAELPLSLGVVIDTIFVSGG